MVWGISPEFKGSGLGALTHAIRHVARLGRPVGGSGRVPETLLTAFEAFGGELRTESRVDTILCADDDVRGEFLSSDSTGLIRFNDFWGRWTEIGVHGDPTCATAEKGKVAFEGAVSGLVRFVDEWRDWPIEERKDQHTGPVQSEIRW